MKFGDLSINNTNRVYLAQIQNSERCEDVPINMGGDVKETEGGDTANFKNGAKTEIDANGNSISTYTDPATKETTVVTTSADFKTAEKVVTNKKGKRIFAEKKYDGKLQSRSDYYKDGKTIQFLTEYDDNGDLSLRKEFDKEGNLVAETSFNKDGSYMLKSPKSNESPAKVSYYAANKELKKTELLDAKGAVNQTEEYETDAEGNKITRIYDANKIFTTKKVVSTDGTSKVYSGMHEDDQSRPKLVVKYDANGKPISETRHKYGVAGGRKYPKAIYNRAEEFIYEKGKAKPIQDVLIFTKPPEGDPTLQSNAATLNQDGSVIESERHAYNVEIIEGEIVDTPPEVIDSEGSVVDGYYREKSQKVIDNKYLVIDGQNIAEFSNGEVIPKKYAELLGFENKMRQEQQPQI